MPKVIACVDDSTYTLSVCDHAAWAALRLNAAIDLLHVLDPREIESVPRDYSGVISFDKSQDLMEEYVALEEQQQRLARRRGAMILESAKAHLQDRALASIETIQRHGIFVETVVEMAPDAVMIVIGKRGESAEHAGQHLGSNLERLARSVRTPMLVVPNQFEPIERVLIAFDGEKSSVKATEHFAGNGLLEGASCHLLAVGSPDNASLRKQLDESTAMLAATGIEASSELTPGDPDKIIADKISNQNADLLVMGAYGHSRIRDLIIGSTTTSLLRSSPVPVLMYR